MCNLLIVDDQEGIRLLLREVFKQDGYCTHLAASGVEALAIVETYIPDCVLLDMRIPGMDGITILSKLRELFPNLPIIMMTAYGEVTEIEKTKQLGAVAHFTKPFNIFEIRATVNKILLG